MKPSCKHPLLTLLNSCTTLHTLKQIHGQFILNGLILHTYPISRLLLVSSSLASISYTLAIFNRVLNPTIFLYNTLISSCIRNGHAQIALSLYHQVIAGPPHLEPNSYTFPSLFKAFGARELFRHGAALHAHVVKFLQHPHDNFVQVSLLNFYSRCGRVDVARYFFDRIVDPDLAAWNSILSAYARISDYDEYFSLSCSGEEEEEEEEGIISSSMEVLNLFSLMQQKRSSSSMEPSELTLVALIMACANLSALSQGTWAHAYALRDTNNLRINHFMGTALITLYSNCGSLHLASQLFSTLPLKDTFCFNAMIRGYAIHGYGHDALDLFETMKREGFAPDDFTMLGVISACSHVGLVDQGRKHFGSIADPKLEHYCSLVDLLGRSGLLEEAEEVILSMPLKPNAILWRCLLGGARVHGNAAIGETASRKLVEIEAETSGNYVLLSNLYADLKLWDDADRLRVEMKDEGISKVPGFSEVVV
ncbi:hypothetical protein M569_13609 [Genlisea aurea]|uniref:Pentatricopeptide repeat-containing protein n=1 Tax=Genlisea aurea TaxID=192259 RepID=S8DEH5_9LAMI|nr:hypothetical protein M569_13609 [Genlisea aurea]